MASGTDLLLAALKIAAALEAIRELEVGHTAELPEVKVRISGKRLKLRIEAEREG